MWGAGIIIWRGHIRENVVERTDKLPFEEKSFDTITFLACLNHIPYRVSALKEAVRILKRNGQVIITMIGPFVGKISHMFNGKDETMRGLKKGETLGLSYQELKNIFNEAGLGLIKIKKIFSGINKIYILEKKS